MREDRKKIWIDVFQTRLLTRTFLYWFIYTVALWNLLFVWRLLQAGPGDPLQQYWEFFVDFYPALIVFAVVFPVLAYDAVKFSHRIVGPLYRFRQTLKAIAEGEPVRMIKLRKEDFLSEMRDEFNEMLEALQRRGLSVLKPADEDEPQQRHSA